MQRDPRNGEDVFDLIADIMIAKRAEWRNKAACRGHQTSVFFGSNGTGPDETAAKSLCGRCPVIQDCQEDWGQMSGAMQRHGIWWGRTPRER